MDPRKLKVRFHPSREDFHRAKISIWWDFENCQIPKNFDVLSVANNICSALEKLNYYGDSSIRAYGDTRLITSMQGALTSTGIRLIHVPGGKKEIRTKMIIDMLLWSIDNPSPVNYLLIYGDGDGDGVGDGDFTDTLDSLKLKRHNILLAHSEATSHVCDMNTIWKWTSLVAGEPPYVSKDICDPVLESHKSRVKSKGKKKMDGRN